MSKSSISASVATLRRVCARATVRNSPAVWRAGQTLRLAHPFSTNPAHAAQSMQKRAGRLAWRLAASPKLLCSGTESGMRLAGNAPVMHLLKPSTTEKKKSMKALFQFRIIKIFPLQASAACFWALHFYGLMLWFAVARMSWCQCFL